MKYVCDVCGYVYDPEIGDPDNGVDAGTAWEDVPEDWVCPLCGVGAGKLQTAVKLLVHERKYDLKSDF